MSHIILFHVINFTKTKQNRKNKQTNRKNVGGDTATALRGQLQRARILIKRKKKEIFKKHSDTRKTRATHNKLLDETRDEHYYILNGQN